MDNAISPHSEPKEIVGNFVKRRVALLMTFKPRTGRGSKHMQKDLAYFLRYAGLANNSETGRIRYESAIAWARQALASRLSGYPESWQAGYEVEVELDTIHYNAEYACVVAYVSLFPVADRIYFALDSDGARANFKPNERKMMLADVYRILRNVTVQVSGGDVDPRV